MLKEDLQLLEGERIKIFMNLSKNLIFIDFFAGIYYLGPPLLCVFEVLLHGFGIYHAAQVEEEVFEVDLNLGLASVLVKLWELDLLVVLQALNKVQLRHVSFPLIKSRELVEVHREKLPHISDDRFENHISPVDLQVVFLPLSLVPLQSEKFILAFGHVLFNSVSFLLDPIFLNLGLLFLDASLIFEVFLVLAHENLHLLSFEDELNLFHLA